MATADRRGAATTEGTTDMTTDMGANAAEMGANATAASEEAVQRIRDLSERFIESAKSAGNQTLDAYEQSLRTLVEFQERAAGANQLDWVSSIASAHAKFVQDVSTAYVSAAREMLK
jgi:hypothetical protein